MKYLEAILCGWTDFIQINKVAYLSIFILFIFTVKK